MGNQIPVAVAYGDGIGPEIMHATLHILNEAGTHLEIHPIEIGEQVYLKGHPTGIEPSTWETIRHTKAFLKAPITTPQGGGFKSLNVTIRTSLGLYANVRPCVAYSPFITTKHPGMNVVIIRENEEDLYSGIEYRHTPDVAHSLKVISKQGSEKIVRYAFEYARKQNRKKVTCFTKDNIMKLSDGLFHHIFTEIAKEYPDIENEHWIVDIGAAKLADTPELFDLIVLPNLYGDILSDVAAQISGSVGLAGSANIGDRGSMFEAIHGSAPRRAGQDMANPSGLIQAAILMLLHLGDTENAARIQNAWLSTLEQGIHTYDIYDHSVSKQKVGTKEFAQAVAKNLGNKPHTLPTVSYARPESQLVAFPFLPETKVERELVGVDLFFYDKTTAPEFLKKILRLDFSPLYLTMVSNRGARIWPEGQPETFCIEQWRCRFAKKGQSVSHFEILKLLQLLADEKFDIFKTENLYLFDKQAGFSSAKG